MRSKVFFSFLTALIIHSLEAAVITSSWLGGSGPWSDPAQWSLGIPQAGYQVLINNTVPASLVTVDIPTAQLNNVAISSNGTLVLANNLSAGEITSFGATTVNGAATLNSGSGGFVQDTATAATTVSSGGSFLDAGNYSQGGGSTQVNGLLDTPLFHVTGGMVTVGSGGLLTIGNGGYTEDLNVATQVDSGGQMNLAGNYSQGNGITTVDGSLSTALFHVTGGTVAVGSGGDLTIGSGGYTQGTAGTVTTIANGGQLNVLGGDFSQETGTSTTVDGILTAATVNNSGTIIGSGSIDANVRNLGTLDPGNGLPITMGIGGNYVQTGFFDVELAGPATNTILQVSGSASLSGTLDVTQLNGFNPAIGETFLVVTYSSITGAFNNISDSGLPAAEFWTAAYDPGGVSLTLETATDNTPENGTLFLSGFGLCVVFVCVNRRQNHPLRSTGRTSEPEPCPLVI